MKKFFRAFFQVLFFGSVLVVLLGGAAFFTYRALQGFFHGSVVSVPDFKFKPLSYALEHKPEGLDLQILERRENREWDRDIILEQKPLPGTRVKRGRKIFLVLSLGSLRKEIPELRGLSLRKAGLQLRQNYLRVGNLAYLPSLEKPAGQILSQDPLPGLPVEEGFPVHLLVSALDPSNKRVPELRGHNFSQVSEDMQRRQIEIRSVSKGYLPEFQDQVVIDQKPLPGMAFGKERYVELVVNTFPEEGEAIKISETGERVQRVEIRTPVGLSSKKLSVELIDESGRRLIHQKVHPPDTLFYLDVKYDGQAFLELSINGLFYRRIELNEVGYGSD